MGKDTPLIAGADVNGGAPNKAGLMLKAAPAAAGRQPRRAPALRVFEDRDLPSVSHDGTSRSFSPMQVLTIRLLADFRTGDAAWYEDLQQVIRTVQGYYKDRILQDGHTPTFFHVGGTAMELREHFYPFYRGMKMPGEKKWREMWTEYAAQFKASLCHDLVEDLGVTRQQLLPLIGARATELVVKATNAGAPVEAGPKMEQYLRYMQSIYQSDDEGAKNVKTADRLDQLKRLVGVPEQLLASAREKTEIHLRVCYETEGCRPHYDLIRQAANVANREAGLNLTSFVLGPHGRPRQNGHFEGIKPLVGSQPLDFGQSATA